MKQKIQKEWFVLAAMVAVIIFGGTYRLTEVGQPIVLPDEFGYWANSSFFIGLDWSSTISNTYYYSYGYSLIMVPIRLLAQVFSWNWRQLYQAMVIVQNLMLVGAFFTAVKLCKRYVSEFNWLVQDLMCFAVFLYPTYIVYVHMTWAETALLLTFWVFLYMLMRLTDNPTWLNHAGFAAVSFYMYMIHQRCLGIVIVSIIIVVCLRLLKHNSFSQIVCFFSVVGFMNCVHNVIKGKLQNDFYMANTSADFYEMITYLLNKTTFVLAAAIVFLLYCLWLIERGKGKIALILVLTAFVVGIIYVIRNFSVFEADAANVEGRLAVNDFAGQLWKIKDIFTLPGFLRLLISIAGKWFYLASASGLVICFGIGVLGTHFIRTTIWLIPCIWKKVFGANTEEVTYESAAIWQWGAFLAWVAIFAISALGMMGIGRVDQLMYGRYHEFAAGVLMIFGFYGIVKDSKWICHLAVFIVVYLLVGWLCQYLLDELGNTSFASCNCVMLGQILKGQQLPTGKIWQIVMRALLSGIFICIVIKVRQETFKRIMVLRMAVVLMIITGLFAYMGMSKTEELVVKRNHTQEKGLSAVSTWINRFYQGERIYFLRDTEKYLSAFALQYKLYDKIVTLERSENIQVDEEAFLVAGASFAENENIRKEYIIIASAGDFVLLAPLEGGIHRRMEEYYNFY